MSEPTILDVPSSPPFRELWLWIGHYADGSERLMSADLPLAGCMRHMPLMNSRREIADQLGGIARRIQNASQHGDAPIVRIELRQFRAATQ